MPLTARPSESASDECLMRRHRRGDSRAREALIARYLPLAHRLSVRYRRGREPVEDLLQVASLALVKAVDRWTPERGPAFSSYAVPTILGELRRYFRDSTWDVRPPRELQERWLSVRRAREDLDAVTGREPSVAELAARLDLSCEQVEEALQAGECRFVLRLDMPAGEQDGESATVGELIGLNDGGYERVEARATVQGLHWVLDDRAREVLRLRFEEGLLQSEIGERVGCSQMHVSRIIGASLDKLSLQASAAPG